MAMWGSHAGTSRFDTARDITLAASGSTHTKGSWAPLWATTPFEIAALHLNLRHGASGLPVLLMDLGIGAAASEVVIVPNVMVGRSLHSETPGPLRLPIRIPAGVRLAARCQASVGAAHIFGTFIAEAAGQGLPTGFGRCTQYGASTVTSSGTDIDAGGTINTKGSWSQLTASTTNPMRAFAVAVHFTGTAVTARWLVDIGIGAAASEQVILPEIVYEHMSTPNTGGALYSGPFYADIPAGTRIAARCQSNGNVSGSRHLNVQVIGLD